MKISSNTALLKVSEFIPCSAPAQEVLRRNVKGPFFCELMMRRNGSRSFQIWIPPLHLYPPSAINPFHDAHLTNSKLLIYITHCPMPWVSWLMRHWHHHNQMYTHIKTTDLSYPIVNQLCLKSHLSIFTHTNCSIKKKHI